jgi:phage/plasmid-associated DNA primase
MANDVEECPVFPGDTRITMVHVSPLTEEEYIAKRDLIAMLQQEAADFLGDVLTLVIPKIKDRLNVPVLMTADKLRAEQANQNELMAFIEENCHYFPGRGMLWAEFHDRFKEYLDPEKRPLWSKRKTGRQLPTKFPKGRNMSDGAKYWIGNISFIHPREADLLTPPVQLVGEALVGLTDNTII